MTDDWTGWTAEERAAEERQRVSDAAWEAQGTMRARAAAARALRDVRRAARLADMAADARATGQDTTP